MWKGSTKGKYYASRLGNQRGETVIVLYPYAPQGTENYKTQLFIVKRKLVFNQMKQPTDEPVSLGESAV